MALPRLKVRPMATRTVTEFGGLWHNPTAPLGRWYDERNLSVDGAPTMTVRQAREDVTALSGYPGPWDIVQVVGGDQLLLVDEMSRLWANGHSVNLNVNVSPLPAGNWQIRYNDHYRLTNDTGTIIYEEGDYGLTITPMRLSWERHDPAHQWDNLDELVQDGGGHRIIHFRYDSGLHHEWESDLNGVWQDVELSDYGISVTYERPLHDGFIFEMETWEDDGGTAQETRITRMGAYAVDFGHGGVWINVEKLASGQAMVWEEDYGPLNRVRTKYSGTIYARMCNIDGEPFAGLSVTSSSEAPDPSGSIRRWIDTSGEKLQLREWSSYTRTWVAAASTYVRVELEGIASGLREGDAVDFSSVMPQTDGEEMGADVRSVQALLNGSHVIQKKISDDCIVLIGIVAPTPNATTGASNLIMIPLERGTGNTENPYVRGSRTVPELDFVVECGNRLWGCRYDQAGEINEIYASALGDFFNWHKFEGLSTDSWTASRGRPAPFTGAAVLGGCPLFFREDSLEKVIPSSSGAHQIRTYDMEGVAAGSQDSLVVIDERLYYKSRHGICVYTGTLPQRISEAFGDVKYANASGARHGRKYCLSMDKTGEAVDPGRMVTTGSPRTAENSEALGERVAAIYDLDTGIWHLEDEAWEGRAATWEDRLYYVRLGRIYAMDGGAATGVDWWAETAPQEIGLPEHKWISYLRIRLALEPGAAVRALVAYDGGTWEPKGTCAGNLLRTQELIIWPRRSDSFRLRLEGTGGAQIQSISYRVERSEGGH